ncbi:hypothetical protein SBI_00176 [Streptomyces bingchenggensis BCW-1]|uniref:Uncharacterized protein n=1 Tax=Streptomyces bingchenggensis (strain BCW-1) TaxID=749414 RepID=D7BUV6_STRBB|nr:hypothetical protein SBI_00176 [Streptomyces bingchenggensis BCW-1]
MMTGTAVVADFHAAITGAISAHCSSDRPVL